MKMKIAALFILLAFFTGKTVSAQSNSLKTESEKTLFVLAEALLKKQIHETGDANHGAIQCNECNVLHTRAAEAVYPFAVVYKLTGKKEYLRAAIDVGNWLIKQQLDEGQWKETPWEWTGTTADQLLMMVNSYPILEKHLTENEKIAWKNSIIRAADYLVKYMSPDFASINYCPTSAAVLALCYKMFNNETYKNKAQELAHWTVAKMNDEGFIEGEAAQVFGVKYGVDLGYEMDMSLWGLDLYAKTMNDDFVYEKVKRSLQKNLYFIYPNGAIDGSWGSRCYKWAAYGSKTADGSQILFALMEKEDPRYVTAALRNLAYLNTMIKDGMVGNGPQYWEISGESVCIYPTFARAKNLAMTIETGADIKTNNEPLPSDKGNWMKYYPSIDLTLARSENFMATISGYGYRDITNWGNGKYTHYPSGGSACNIWVEGHGFLQTSSQTRYVRGEPVHMPVTKDSVICLTPRIEFRSKDGYFTNLYECESRFTSRSNADTVAFVSATGELKNQEWQPGGVGYKLSHAVFNNSIEKTVQIRFHDRQPSVQIVEPIVDLKGMSFEQISPKKVLIKGEKRTFLFEITEGDFEITAGENRENYWYPFPSMKCYPLVINVNPPKNGYEQVVKYAIKIYTN